MTHPTAASIHDDLVHTRAELWLLDRIIARGHTRRITEGIAIGSLLLAYSALLRPDSIGLGIGLEWLGALTVLMLFVCGWLRRDIKSFVEHAEQQGLDVRKCARYLGEGSVSARYREIRHRSRLRLHMLQWANGELVIETCLQQVDRHLESVASSTALDPLQSWYRDARARQRWHEAVRITAAARATAA